MTGASLTASDVKAKTRDAVKKPSLTVKVMFAVPVALETGVIAPVQLGHVPLHDTAPVGATMDGESDVYCKFASEHVSASSTSPAVKATANALSSLVICGELMAVIVGASFTGSLLNV